MKKVMIIWAIVAVILVGGLTYIGFNIKRKDKPYKELEKTLTKQAVALIGEQPSLVMVDNKITIDLFNANNITIDMNVNSDVCDGYVIVENVRGFYNYKPYIKCQNYQTKGYQN